MNAIGVAPIGFLRMNVVRASSRTVLFRQGGGREKFECVEFVGSCVRDNGVSFLA